MNERSVDKIRAAAQFLATYPEAAELAQPHLAEPIQGAIAILEQLGDGKPKTAPEIALVLGMNAESVRQSLRALQWNPLDGGIMLKCTQGNSSQAGWQLPGGKIVWKPASKKL